MIEDRHTKSPSETNPNPTPDNVPEETSVKETKESSVKKVKKSKEIAKYLDIKVPRIVAGEQEYRSFKEFFYIEFRNRIRNILDYYKILGSVRTTYMNFGSAITHDAFIVYINNRVIGIEPQLQKVIDYKIEIWKIKYGVDEEVLRAIANELFEMLKNLKMLKWKFIDYCKKRGIVTEADIVSLKDVL